LENSESVIEISSKQAGGIVFSTDIRVCSERIDHEQWLADAAPSHEAAMVHLQMVMLYKSQLTMLRRRQAAHDFNFRPRAYHSGALNADPC
jgi:hypothetical protein